MAKEKKVINLSEKTMLQIDDMCQLAGGAVSVSGLSVSSVNIGVAFDLENSCTLTSVYCKPPELDKDRVCGQKPF